MKNLNEINQLIRQQLINLEWIRGEIISIKAESETVCMLKERLNEFMRTVIADLLLISEFLTEAEYCEDSRDIKLLLELNGDKTED
jgi:hypothetical protein